MNLNLVDPFQLVLNRIFHGDNVDPFRSKILENTPKRGALTAAGGPGNEDHPLRLAVAALQVPTIFFRHAQGIEIHIFLGLIENTDYDLLPEISRQARHPKVESAPIRLKAYTTVLWSSLVCDIHAGHDLEPADHRLLKISRDGHPSLQHSVQPKSNLQTPACGFQVDIAGFFAYSLQQDQMDQPHDGRDGRSGRALLFPCFLVEDRAVIFINGRNVHVFQVCLPSNISDNLVHSLFHAVSLLNGNVDFLFRTESGMDPHTGGELQGLNCIRILRLGHGNMQNPPGFLQRKRAILLCHGIRQEGNRLRVFQTLTDVHDIHVELPGQCFQKRSFCNHSFPHQNRAESSSPLTLFLQGGIQVFLSKPAIFQQALPQQFPFLHVRPRGQAPG